MSGALLGALLPLGYLLCVSITYVAVAKRLRRLSPPCASDHHKRFHYLDCKECGRSTADGDAGVVATVTIAAFWPLLLWLFVPWYLVQTSELADGMSRKQRAQLAYERESAKIAAEAAKAQQEWQRLLAEEQAS